LHDWLSLVEDVIKNQRIMLGNVDEMQRLTNKQKQVSASGYGLYQVTFQNSKSFIHYLNDTMICSKHPILLYRLDSE
jgi:hypothetical protein